MSRTSGAFDSMEDTRGPSLGPVSPSPWVESALLFGVLEVAEEISDGYGSESFNHWIDADGDGCDTRQEVLIARSLDSVEVGPHCELSEGAWMSRYEYEVFSSGHAELAVIHVVPLAEAWESGAHAWAAPRREQFANVLYDSYSLEIVSADLERSRNDRDPAEWLPPAENSHCFYVGAWIRVKAKWGLTIDRAEADGLRNVLMNCIDEDHIDLLDPPDAAE